MKEFNVHYSEEAQKVLAAFFNEVVKGIFESHLSSVLNRVYELYGDTKVNLLTSGEVISGIEIDYIPFLKSYHETVKISTETIMNDISRMLEERPNTFVWGCTPLANLYADNVYKVTKGERIEYDATDKDFIKYQAVLHSCGIDANLNDYVGVTRTELKSIVNQFLKANGQEVRV